MVSKVFVGFPTITPIILWWILVVLLCFLSGLDNVIHISSIHSFFLQWLRRLYAKGHILFLKKLVAQPDRWETKGTFTRKHHPFSKILRFQSWIQFFPSELPAPLSQSLLEALCLSCFLMFLHFCFSSFSPPSCPPYPLPHSPLLLLFLLLLSPSFLSPSPSSFFPF